jgi:putative DNA methylase
MRRSLREVYPDIFSTVLVPKELELVADHQRFGGREAANAHFEKGMQRVFSNTRHVIDPSYPLTVYYAFKQSENIVDTDSVNGHSTSSTGWETILDSLIDAGFVINGTWPMRTERSARTRGIGSNALASSIVLVCRLRPDEAPQTSRREFVNALRRELPKALREMQSGSIAPVDLAQASIGPGMAIYSRYRQVLEADGSPLTVRTALQLINQELDAYLAETEGDVDTDTRFCINWFEQFGFKEGEFGQADVLARAKNTSVDGLVNAGVLQAGAGKVRLYQWQEVEPGWTPQEDKRVTVWEAVTHLIERINTHGESGSAALLLRMNSDLAAEAKNLAYRLYQICDRKGWADLALDYNALVVSWPGLQERANEMKHNQPPEQLGLF